MQHTPCQSISRKSRTYDGAAFIVGFDQIKFLNASICRVLIIDSQRPVITAIYFDPMIDDIIEKRIFAVALTVIAVARMGRQHLQRVFGKALFIIRPFPAGLVTRQWRAFGILRIKAF